MKMKEAQAIIDAPYATGYMVSFEHLDGLGLRSDHFPDKHAGEPLIETKIEAWSLADRFARKTVGRCVNIYVIDSNFNPVPGYKRLMIENRK